MKLHSECGPFHWSVGLNNLEHSFWVAAYDMYRQIVLCVFFVWSVPVLVAPVPVGSDSRTVRPHIYRIVIFV
jgi:hypothetical protein